MPKQVIREGFGGGIVELHAVGQRWPGRSRRLVHVIPTRVDREFLGNADIFNEAVAFVVCLRWRVFAAFPLGIAAQIFCGNIANVVVFRHFEHWIGFDSFAYLEVQLHRRELHQAYRLLQLRRHGHLLAEFQGQGLFHSAITVFPGYPGPLYNSNRFSKVDASHGFVR